ncbi:MAG: heme A synthase, partial [Psychrobacillus sp.]
RAIYWGWIISLILVSCQVVTGMVVVLTKLNLYIALLHSLFISLLFGLLCYLILLLSRSKTSN